MLQSIWGSLPETMGVQPHPRPQPGQPGSFLVPATVWPGPRLPRETTSLSRSLHNSLGRPPEGATVVIYTWPDVSQLPSAAPPSDGNAAGLRKDGLASPVATNNSRPGMGAGTGKVYLRLCRNATTGGPAVVESAAATNNSRPSAPSSSSPVAGRPTQTTSPAKSTPGASPSKPAGPAGLSEGNTRQRGAAEELMKHRLAGRRLLPGNPVLLTLMGQPLLFAVEVSGEEQTHGSDWAGISVAKDTVVKVLVGDETPPPPKPPAAPTASPQVFPSHLVLSTCVLSCLKNMPLLAPRHGHEPTV